MKPSPSQFSVVDTPPPNDVIVRRVASASSDEWVGEVLSIPADSPMTAVVDLVCTARHLGGGWATTLKFRDAGGLWYLAVSGIDAQGSHAGFDRQWTQIPLIVDGRMIGRLGVCADSLDYAGRQAQHYCLKRFGHAVACTLKCQFHMGRIPEGDEHAMQREQERLLNLLINSFAGPVAYWDENLHCLFTNSGFGDWYGLRASEARGKGLREIFDAVGAGEESDLNFGKLLTGHRSSQVVAHRVDGGATRHLLTNFVPDMDGQEFRGLVSIGADVTNFVETRQELERRTEQAEAAARTKSQFLANMSHEIRTPMNAIIGMTDLALETKLTADQRDLLEIVKDAGYSLLNLINDILDFSKLEAGRLELENQPFDLVECVRRSVQLLDAKAREKAIALDWVSDQAVPRYVVGDSYRLRQVLVNLLSNAVKFTDRGWVLLSVSVSSGEPAANTCLLNFSVKDTGIGIQDDLIEKVLQPFSQADGSTTRRFGGTGLGLSICKELVNQMGGALRISGSPGKGSEFAFTVPLPVSDQMARVDGDWDCELLIADRSPLPDAELMSGLAREGARATVAKTPALLLERLQACERPAVVVIKTSWLPLADQRFWESLAATVPPQRRVLLVDKTPFDTEKAGQYAQEIRWPSSADALFRLLPGVMRAGPERSVTATLGRLILLTDDNAVNRKLAVRMLESMGHDVVVAVNGKEAVARSSEQRFDLILMDVQMPVMGGFAAAQAIREREADDRHKTPILAMTAHALPEDRERSLAAGMDGHLSKPISKAALAEAVATYALADNGPTKNSAPHDSAADDSTVPGPVQRDEQLLNIAEALSNLDGDQELLGEVLRLFLDSVDASVRNLQTAAGEQNWEHMAAVAHSVKGESSTIGAGLACSLASELEQACRSGLPPMQCLDLSTRLVGQIHQVSQAVREYLGQQSERSIS